MKSFSESSEPKPSKSGIRRICNAFFYSAEGIGSTLKHEAAFRQESILAAIMIPVALILPVGMVGKALMIGSVFLVLIIELLNSSMEWAIDYISEEKHPYAKRAKDMGSAAVFLAIINCLGMWMIVLTYKWDAIRGMFAG